MSVLNFLSNFERRSCLRVDKGCPGYPPAWWDPSGGRSWTQGWYLSIWHNTPETRRQNPYSIRWISAWYPPPAQWRISIRPGASRFFNRYDLRIISLQFYFAFFLNSTLQYLVDGVRVLSPSTSFFLWWWLTCWVELLIEISWNCDSISTINSRTFDDRGFGDTPLKRPVKSKKTGH